MSTAITSGERVRQLRQQMGMAQQRFADLLGVSRGYLGDIELGRSEPSVAFLTAVTSRTDGSADWILTGKGQMLRTANTSAGTALPAGLAGNERRISALLTLLAQLDPESREAILSDCFARATTAQQLTELRLAVQELEAAKRA